MRPFFFFTLFTLCQAKYFVVKDFFCAGCEINNRENLLKNALAGFLILMLIRQVATIKSALHGVCHCTAKAIESNAIPS